MEDGNLVQGVDVTTLSTQEGFRGTFPVVVSAPLARRLGYSDDSVNWRVRSLLAAAASAIRDANLTPVHKFRHQDKLEARRFQFSDELEGRFSVCSLVVPTEGMLPNGRKVPGRLIYLCGAEELQEKAA